MISGRKWNAATLYINVKRLDGMSRGEAKMEKRVIKQIIVTKN